MMANEDIFIEADVEDEIDEPLVKAGLISREEQDQLYQGKLSPAPETASTRPAKSVADELSEIQKLRKTDKRGYFQDERIQERERELLTEQASAQGTDKGVLADLLSAENADDGADQAANPLQTELEEIQKFRKENKRAFFADAEMQARELEIIKALQSEGASGIAAELLDEWDQAGGIEHNLGIAKSAVQMTLAAMPEEGREGFEVGFDGLPQAAQTAVLRELALAPRRPGDLDGALDRIDRIEASLSPGDADIALKWLEALSDKQKDAVLRGLAG